MKKTNKNNIHLQPFKLHNLDVGPSTEATITKNDAIELYKQMQMIRRLETSAGNLYKDKIVRGFCHLYSGQEACAVGMYHLKNTLVFMCVVVVVARWVFM